MHSTDWTKVNRVMIANSNDSMLKHEHIKLELVRQLNKKYPTKKRLNHEFYTEYPLNGKIADVVHINKKEKTIIAYEIQKNITKKWIEETSKFYQILYEDGLEIDWVLINLKKIDSDINKMAEQISKQIL